MLLTYSSFIIGVIMLLSISRNYTIITIIDVKCEQIIYVRALVPPILRKVRQIKEDKQV